jgi:hypothetical protein
LWLVALFCVVSEKYPISDIS